MPNLCSVHRRDANVSPWRLRAVLLLAAWPALAAPAGAQFVLFDWTEAGNLDGSATLQGEVMTIVGPDGGFGTCDPNTTVMQTTAVVPGTVSVQLDFLNLDASPCSTPPAGDPPAPLGSLFDFPVYLVNGEETVIGPTQCFNKGEYDVQFSVQAGDVFGFGVRSSDCIEGPGIATLTDFGFAPEVWVDLGGALDPRLKLVVSGAAGDSDFGAAVADAGDLDGDGRSDLLVGTGTEPLGVVRVHSSANGALLREWTGAGSFGASVAGVGDLDGDGLPETLVGSPGFDDTATNTGRAQVFRGSDGSVLYEYGANVAATQTGRSVASAGDVDGDGVPDLAIGLPKSGTEKGRVRVYSGVDGELIIALVSDQFGDAYGSAVACAGDVDADGVPDVLIGAPNFGPSTTNTGRIQVRSGADGTDLLTVTGNAAFAADPSLAPWFFGRAVSGAGDVNLDGFADVAVGSPLTLKDGTSAGSATVHSGIDGERLTLLLGDFGDALGTSLSGGLDLDADGAVDLLVGVPGAGGGPDGDPGTARLVRAADGAVLHELPGQPGDGQGAAVALLADADVNGLGDALVGAPGTGTPGRVALYTALDQPSTVPRLDGEGSLLPGEPFALTVSGAAPSAPAFLVLGLSLLQAPFKGGVLVPAPDLISSFSTAPDGGAVLGGSWPANVPTWTNFVLQIWIVDALGPQGFTSTNGLLSYTP